MQLASKQQAKEELKSVIQKLKFFVSENFSSTCRIFDLEDDLSAIDACCDNKKYSRSLKDFIKLFVKGPFNNLLLQEIATLYNWNIRTVSKRGDEEGVSFWKCIITYLFTIKNSTIDLDAINTFQEIAEIYKEENNVDLNDFTATDFDDDHVGQWLKENKYLMKTPESVKTILRLNSQLEK